MGVQGLVFEANIVLAGTVLLTFTMGIVGLFPLDVEEVTLTVVQIVL